jgi:hypothetical protein
VLVATAITAANSKIALIRRTATASTASTATTPPTPTDVNITKPGLVKECARVVPYIAIAIVGLAGQGMRNRWIGREESTNPWIVEAPDHINEPYVRFGSVPGEAKLAHACARLGTVAECREGSLVENLAVCIGDSLYRAEMIAVKKTLLTRPVLVEELGDRGAAYDYSIGLGAISCVCLMLVECPKVCRQGFRLPDLGAIGLSASQDPLAGCAVFVLRDICTIAGIDMNQSA